jgi:hypothetical protein
MSLRKQYDGEECQRKDGPRKVSAGDLTIADIAQITGASYNTCADAFYYGEYQFKGRRLIRREIWDTRRKTGQSVTVETKEAQHGI